MSRVNSRFFFYTVDFFSKQRHASSKKNRRIQPRAAIADAVFARVHFPALASAPEPQQRLHSLLSSRSDRVVLSDISLASILAFFLKLASGPLLYVPPHGRQSEASVFPLIEIASISTAPFCHRENSWVGPAKRSFIHRAPNPLGSSQASGLAHGHSSCISAIHLLTTH